MRYIQAAALVLFFEIPMYLLLHTVSFLASVYQGLVEQDPQADSDDEDSTTSDSQAATGEGDAAGGSKYNVVIVNLQIDAGEGDAAAASKHPVVAVDSDKELDNNGGEFEKIEAVVSSRLEMTPAVPISTPIPQRASDGFWSRMFGWQQDKQPTVVAADSTIISSPDVPRAEGVEEVTEDTATPLARHDDADGLLGEGSPVSPVDGE